MIIDLDLDHVKTGRKTLGGEDSSFIALTLWINSTVTHPKIQNYSTNEQPESSSALRRYISI